jgi:hypothetical protein
LEITDANIIRIANENPNDYRRVLNDLMVRSRSARERRIDYKKLNNRVFRLRQKGLLPPSGTGLVKRQSHVERVPKIVKTHLISSHNTKAAGKSFAHFGQISETVEDETKTEGDLKLTGGKILIFLVKRGSPATYSEIFAGTELPHSTSWRELKRLLLEGMIQRNNNKTWSLTEKGMAFAQKLLPHEQLYQMVPEDSFFYQIPMLIDHAGQVFNAENIAERACGYLGFYQRIGIPQSQAAQDFHKKIRSHLENEALKNTLIQQEGLYDYKAIPDEDQFLLWRLYSMLHSILFKSTRGRKLGSAIWIYEPLLDMLKKYWKIADERLRDLPERDRHVIMLMLNGVQLETIVEKEKVANIRNQLMLCNIPFKIYNEGANNETTIIEVVNPRAKENLDHSRMGQ